MKNIKAIQGFIRFLSKKHRSNHLTPEEIDDAINWASLDKFNELYGHYNKFQSPVPVPRNGHEINQKNKDDLSVFLTEPVDLVNNGGTCTLPDDYVHVSMLQTTNEEMTREVEFIRDDKWSFRINRLTSPPSYNYPVCRQYSKSLELRPTDLSELKITYLKKPTKAVWAYDMVNGRPVYNDDNSVDFEWGEENHMDIIARALTYLGINLEDVNLFQYKDLRTQSES